MKALSLLLVVASAVRAAFWMESIAHHGISPLNPDKSYAVFRNVRDFGAKGDGVTDDTAAINAAISSGNRCMAYSCVGTTTTPAVVYFPPGTYLITSAIINYYYTQLIGDPNSKPVIKGAASFSSPTIGLLEGNRYMDNGRLSFVSTNVFFRQVRNLVFDTTDVRGEISAIHWPSSQATSIQNCVFKLSSLPGDAHTGIFMEDGSGGMLSDLVFYGGKYGAQFGNQQYTMRNLTFYNAETAILQIWNWGWTYKSLNIVNCRVGINMSSDAVGSAILLDSNFRNVPIAIVTGHDPTNSTSRGSLVIENVRYSNVAVVLQRRDGRPLLMGNLTGVVFETGYATGNLYSPQGPTQIQGRETTYFYQPSTLKMGNKYYERPKPQYESYPPAAFLSAREHGALGDGITDDTQALNALFRAVASGRFSTVAFLDAGHYSVSDTIYVPSGARIVGEVLAAVIVGTGPKFSDINNPHPVVMIGRPAEVGYVAMSDVIVSTKGTAPGAVLIQYNLYSPATPNATSANHPPSGLWDVHTRVGGFAGSGLQVANCPITPFVINHVDSRCIGAHTSMHITSGAGNLYIENSWLWVADHDIEDIKRTRITVYAGRGLLIEGSRIWLVGTAVEHHALYQYQLVNASDIWMGQIQTETPYYQPNPPAPYPFRARSAEYWDPDFDAQCLHNPYNREYHNGTATLDLPGSPPCAMAWGLRILSSENVLVFGAGLYSFFANFHTTCSQAASGENCQARIFAIGPAMGDGFPRGALMSKDLSTVQIYNLNTVGAVSMVTQQGADMALWRDNYANFASTLAVFRYRRPS